MMPTGINVSLTAFLHPTMNTLGYTWPMDVYQIYLQIDTERGYKVRSMPVANYDYTATKSWYHIQYQC